MDQAATRRNVLVLAIVLALLAGVLMWFYLGRVGNQSAGNVLAVFASESIPAMTVIESAMVEERVVRKSDVPEGVSTSQDFVVGKVAMNTFETGARIQASQVQDKFAVGGLAYRVPIGMRAVTVALDPIIGVAGFLKPGNHVDVLATFKLNEGSVTKTVLQDQVLLATGAQIINTVTVAGKQGQAENVPNATLSVGPLDAEKLILAESKGKLRLTLRAQGDIVRAYSNGINSRSLIGYVPPDVDKKASKPISAPPARIIYSSMRGPSPSSLIYGQMPLPTVTHQVKPAMEIEVIKGAQVERVPVKT